MSVHLTPPHNTRDINKMVDLAVAGYGREEIVSRFGALPAVLQPLALQRLEDYAAGADVAGELRIRVADALEWLKPVEA